MLQQTTVRAVAPYYARFLARWPDVGALAAAPLEEVLQVWAGLGYYARARNLHACARAVVEQYDGSFRTAKPRSASFTASAPTRLRRLPPSPSTPAMPVDGNIERVIARLYAVPTPLPAAKPEISTLARALAPRHRSGDFAQAMMDLGATICSPKRPACALCPWNESCDARARGDAETFPLRTPKREGVPRRGAAFVALRTDGFVLVRTRPPKGLLGGMTEVPTTPWLADFDERTALASAPRFGSPRRGGKRQATWRRIAGVVRHTFTHFPLELSVYAAEVAVNTPAPTGTRWIALADLGSEALPTLMRKVVAHAGTDSTKASR